MTRCRYNKVKVYDIAYSTAVTTEAEYELNSITIRTSPVTSYCKDLEEN